MNSSDFSKRPSLFSATNNKPVDLGIQLEFQGTNCYIASILKGSTAEKEGFLVGDKITQINSKPIDSLLLEEVEEKLKGPLGSSVKITLQRNGEVFDFSLTRGEVLNKKPKISTQKSTLQDVLGPAKKKTPLSLKTSPISQNKASKKEETNRSEPLVGQPFEQQLEAQFQETSPPPKNDDKQKPMTMMERVKIFYETSSFKLPGKKDPEPAPVEQQLENEYPEEPLPENTGEQKPMTMMERVKIFYETSSFKLPGKKASVSSNDLENDPLVENNEPEAYSFEQQIENEFQEDPLPENAGEQPPMNMAQMKIFYETSAFKAPAKNTPPPPKKASNSPQNYTLNATLAKNKTLKTQETKKNSSTKIYKRNTQITKGKYVLLALIILILWYTLRTQFPGNQEAEREAFLQKRREARQEQEKKSNENVSSQTSENK